MLEDIDAAFASREDTAIQKAAFEGLNRVTFSGLLNCLDGVASTASRIVSMSIFCERLAKHVHELIEFPFVLFRDAKLFYVKIITTLEIEHPRLLTLSFYHSPF